MSETVPALAPVRRPPQVHDRGHVFAQSHNRTTWAIIDGRGGSCGWEMTLPLFAGERQLFTG